MTTTESDRSLAELPSGGQAIAHGAGGGAMARYDITAAKQRLAHLEKFFKDVLVEADLEHGKSGDYGKIPGTTSIVILRSGAEKLAEFYGLRLRPRETAKVEQWDVAVSEDTFPLFHYQYEMDAFDSVTGALVGTGLGSCNSYEPRFRYRGTGRACPECDAIGTVKPSRFEGQAFYCNAKAGGCGAGFKKGSNEAQALEEQKAGRVQNVDIHGEVNSILKRAKKRALCDVIESLTRATGLACTVSADDESTHDGGGDTGGGHSRGRQRRGGAALLNERQLDLIIAKQGAKKIPDPALKAWLKETLGIDSRKDIPAAKVNDVLAWIEKYDTAVRIYGEPE